MADEAGEQRVTLIVPTVHHRAWLFARVLRYFDEIGFRTPIVVSDHSPAGQEKVIAGIAARHPNLDLKVLHHSPSLHFLERLTRCAAEAATPYVHLHADDDFVVRPTLVRLIQEMDERSAVAAAMGINVHAEFASRDLTVIPKVDIASMEPFERLVTQLETYSSVLYALRRREEFIASLTFAVGRCPDVQFWQYLESCLAALAGQVFVIERLHYVRQVHEEKWSATLVRERSADHFPYLVLSPEFGPRVAAFKAALIEACAARKIAVNELAIDAGLVHLLYRGFGAMGLPPKSIAAAPDTTQEIASRLLERLARQTEPESLVMNRISALASE